jgi:hypothetical protein
MAQCGKIFKNASLVSFHAEKSGHSQFEESTEEVGRRRSHSTEHLTDFVAVEQYVPLTEEQKKEKLEELRAKLAEKRAAQAKIDAVQNKANEVRVTLTMRKRTCSLSS